jgi:hypothetical protein
MSEDGQRRVNLTTWAKQRGAPSPARLGHANGCVSTRAEAALEGDGLPVKQAEQQLPVTTVDD